MSDRLVSLDREGGMILRIGGKWHRGLVAEQRATRAEKIQAEWLREQQRTEFPLYAGDGLYYWPNDPSEHYTEIDVVCDLKAIFGFSEADAVAICESSRGLHRLRTWLNQD